MDLPNLKTSGDSTFKDYSVISCKINSIDYSEGLINTLIEIENTPSSHSSASWKQEYSHDISMESIDISNAGRNPNSWAAFCGI